MLDLIASYYRDNGRIDAKRLQMQPGRFHSTAGRDCPGTFVFCQVLEKFTRAGQRAHLMTKPRISRGVQLPQPFNTLRTYRNPGFPQEHVSEKAATHADPSVNAPDRQIYPFLVQSFSPSEYVLIDAIDECTIQVKKKNGLEARHGNDI
jgi:hypothetical protein